ncbi:MAG: LysR family transcriptional regulator [Myxococcales bacterium]|nr:MAG: LysR family transcriptional regulator [Myxococcales bacterium]
MLVMVLMRAAHVADLDLNLLVTLDTLLQERSVTRAAERLGVTQPAVSHRLRLLREQLDDPLLVGGRGSLHLTERARQLAAPLGRALLDVRAALRSGEPFDPARSERVFAVVAGDVGEMVVLPEVMSTLRVEAPHVTMTSPAAGGDVVARLASGEIDLVVGAPLPPQAGLVQRVVGRERYVVLARPDHPAIRRGRLSARAFADASHVVVSRGGPPGSSVDEALERLGLRRHVAARVSHFVTAPYLVLRSDLLLTMGESLARTAARHLPLALLPHPLTLPSFDVLMTWHERSTGDEGHRWMRELAARVTARSFQARPARDVSASASGTRPESAPDRPAARRPPPAAGAARASPAAGARPRAKR